MSKRDWTTGGLATVREHYPLGGPRAVWLRLPDNAKRSFDAIHCAAKKLGVKCTTPTPRERRASCPEMDAAIRALTPMGDLSRRYGVSREWLKARAAQLGARYATSAPRRWTPIEEAILIATEGKPPQSARYQLSKAGYSRGIAAINQRRSKLAVQGRREFEGYFTLYELADLLGRQPDTVKRWTAMRTDPLPFKRNGQFYLFRHGDVRQWIRHNPERMDLARLPVAHYPWFFELLTGASPRQAD